MTDASGNPVGEQRYYPYGETRFTSGTIYTDRLFTGQRDTALGIYYYGARFYSQKLGRFLSPDSIVPGAANPQAYNRYSYVLGNPLRYTDPTGHMQASDDDYCYGCTLPSPLVCSSSMCNPNAGGGGGSHNNNNHTQTSTPSPTSTPCSIVLTACQPTSTSTPFPTNTATPTSTLTPYTGPMYTNQPPPQPYLDFAFYVNWDRVDKIDAAIDGIGLAADIVSLAFAPAAPVAQTIGTVAEGIGFIKSGVELIQGNPQSMLVSQTTDAAKATVMVFRLERMIPIPLVGAVGNVVSLGINLQPQVSIKWVTP